MPWEAHEFFAGGGLAGIGLAGAGFATTFANDIDPAKAQAFRTNHPDMSFHQGDVWDLTADDLPGRPDLCWASSPCQDVSLAGARAGLAGVRSGAFWGFWSLIQGLERQGRTPRAIVIENVCGLLTSSGGTDFAAVCGKLAEGGYRVGALEIDAALWTPQSRPRLFIVGLKDGGAETTGPQAPFHSARLVAAVRTLPQTVRDVWAWWAMSAPARRNIVLADLLQDDGAVVWFDEKETAALLALMTPLHRARLDTALASGRRTVAAAYRRVRAEQGIKTQRLEARFDGLAGCLRTPAGGSSRQYVLVAEDGRVKGRRLTGREAARLMGLDDGYRLPASESAALKLMGDAVVTPVVRALAEQVLAPALARRTTRAA